MDKLMKVQKTTSKQRDSKEWIEFKVYRDDPNDPFKPNSEEAVHKLAQTPRKTALDPNDELLLQSVAADLDRTLSVEEIIRLPFQPPKISEECLAEIERMPSWLRSMIEVRYTLIHGHFKNDTVKFLRSINNRIDGDYRSVYSSYNGPMAGDIPGQVDALENKAIEEFAIKAGMDQRRSYKGGPASINLSFRVAGMVAKWKRKHISDQIWEPHFVHRAAAKLRRGLCIKPAAADVAFAAEEELRIAAASDSEDDEGSKWKDLVRLEEVRKEAEAQVDAELRVQRQEEKRQVLERRKTLELERKLSRKRAKARKKAEKKKASEMSKKGSRKPSRNRQQEKRRRWARTKPKLEVKSPSDKKGDGLHKHHHHHLTRKEKEKLLFDRGHFRRYSRLFSTGCGDPVDPPKRLEHHYRRDESFHAYIVTLVGSKWFKGFVLFVIFLNAIVLALETAEGFEEEYLMSEIFDEIFLAFYLTEAIVKIYAHPYRYWTSGFNLFDFVILCVSVTKTLVDWFNLADISVLRVLLIVRALRVLRGISLSIQLQVLVTALVETIKTNILSVVILLVLLVYIAAIVAFYLFGDKEGLVDVWGSVPPGMLRMISFVTLDGWFNLMGDFENAGYQTQGRVFNLICIVLGNFMFSNIFIAIIIMNISEATDIFRERIRKEREEVIRRKKELVFRRQKLDMRQLLARQKRSLNADFFQLAGQFQKLLRHDDLVSMYDVCTSPLWMDSCYQCLLRTEHTSNLLMNLHRQMVDNLLDQHRIHRDSKMNTKTLRRGRYNRYMKLKAKLALIKHEIVQMKGPPAAGLRIRYAKAGENEDKRRSIGSRRSVSPSIKPK